jgi:TonB family protein
VQSSRHDANLASLRASSLPGYVLDVVVLTSDGGLLATLRDASSAEHAIWHAPSADAAVDLLVGGRCGILIADLGTLRSDAAALLERLHAQFPELVLMATGRRQEESAVASLVGDGRIYRFLHKPISPARASLFIGAATRRYFELRNTQPIALTTMRTMAARPHAGKIAAAIIAALALAIVALVWLFTKEDASRATLQAPIASGPTSEQQVADHLARAQIAYASGRLVEPRGDNALEYYRQTLALAPNHADALAGIERIATELEARFAAAIEAHNPADGALALAALQRAQPNHPRLTALQSRLVALSRSMRPMPSSAEPRIDAPPDPPSASTTEDTELAIELDSQGESTAVVAEQPVETSGEQPAESDAANDGGAETQPVQEEDRGLHDAFEQLQLAATLRERDMLIEPAGNNAFEYMQSLVAQYPDLEGVRTEQQRLVFTLLEHTRTLVAAGEIDEASVFLDRADQLMPGLSATQALRGELRIAFDEREFLRNIAQAASLKRIREVTAEYPRSAQYAAIEGWVDVEFTIAPDGSTQDFTIRDANPRGVFEKSALDALKRWRFAPILRNGAAVPQRALLRIKFELED